MPYDTYAKFVDICHMCGRYVHDTEMSQYVKTTRERYTYRQTQERPIFDLETKLEEVTLERNTYKVYYETERAKRETLQAELKTLQIKSAKEITRLKTELESIRKPHRTWNIFGNSLSQTSKNNMHVSLAELKELTFL
jgi:chaperonin cofactor prefoldin